MTPPRSENIPPNEASVSGVAYLIIDARSESVRMVLSIYSFRFRVQGSGFSVRTLNPERRTLTFSNRSSNKPLCPATEHGFASDKQYDDRLQDHDPVLRYVVGEDIDEQARAIQCAE